MKLYGLVLPILFVIIFLINASPAQAAIVISSLPTNDDGFAIGATTSHAIEWGAVGFTPDQDLTLTSVTLWLTGYTGVDDQRPEVSIWSDTTASAPNLPHAPATSLTAMSYGYSDGMAFNTPAPNDGSSASFEFDYPGELTLQGGTIYWLVVDEVTPPDNDGLNVLSFFWNGGGSVTGEAAYVGSEQLIIAGLLPSSTTPAFSIDAIPVPEPRPMAIMALSFFCAGAYALRLRRKVLYNK
jgi:hypothetical protein